MLSLRCHQRARLKAQWEAQAGHAAAWADAQDASSLTVEHGECNGPCESALAATDTAAAPPRSIGACAVPVRYRGACGHMQADAPCGQAFTWAAGGPGAPQCASTIAATSPLCGHAVQAPCWLSSSEAWQRLQARRPAAAAARSLDSAGAVPEPDVVIAQSALPALHSLEGVQRRCWGWRARAWRLSSPRPSCSCRRAATRSAASCRVGTRSRCAHVPVERNWSLTRIIRTGLDHVLGRWPALTAPIARTFQSRVRST